MLLWSMHCAQLNMKVLLNKIGELPRPELGRQFVITGVSLCCLHIVPLTLPIDAGQPFILHEHTITTAMYLYVSHAQRQLHFNHKGHMINS